MSTSAQINGKYRISSNNNPPVDGYSHLTTKPNLPLDSDEKTEWIVRCRSFVDEERGWHFKR